MTADPKPLLETNLPGVPVRRGKVRDVYDLGDCVLLVATDRISAFDVVMPTGIPGKGELLTRISAFWFRTLPEAQPHHLIRVVQDAAPAGLEAHLSTIRGRTMVCKKTQVIPIECVVRGYLAGSGWASYQKTGRVCGIELPPGLQQCDRLPAPIFTPATKADAGHDENISFDEACERAGGDLMRDLRDRSIALFQAATAHARDRGVIIADTKFEFGRTGRDILLIDEILTPDSSRFWPGDRYQPGRDQESFDKQYVRNYLETLVTTGTWNKTPPGPALPPEIVINTAARYREAAERLTAGSGSPHLHKS